jgi:hypothetical protein
MNRPPPWVAVLAVVFIYIIVTFGTYGYTVQRRDLSSVEAAFAGVLWPLYWGGRLVIGCAEVAEDMFKPAPPVKVER